MKTAFIISFILVMIISSCTTYERCIQKYGDTVIDTVDVEYSVTVPRDSIVTRIMLDTIPFMVPGDTVVIEDPESRAKISYWKSAYEDALEIRADCDSVTITDTVRVEVSQKVFKPPPLSRREQLWRGWANAAGVALPLIILIIVAIIILKLK